MASKYLTTSILINSDEPAAAALLKDFVDQIDCLVFDETVIVDTSETYVQYHLAGNPAAIFRFKVYCSGYAIFYCDIYKDNVLIHTAGCSASKSTGTFYLRAISSPAGFVFEGLYDAGSYWVRGAFIGEDGDWYILDARNATMYDTKTFGGSSFDSCFYSALDANGKYLLTPLRMISGGSISPVSLHGCYGIFAFTGDRSFLTLTDGRHAFYIGNKIYVL